MPNPVGEILRGLAYAVTFKLNINNAKIAVILIKSSTILQKLVCPATMSDDSQNTPHPPTFSRSPSPSFAPSTARGERPMENGIEHEAMQEEWSWSPGGWPAPIQTPDNSRSPPAEMSASPPLEIWTEWPEWGARSMPRAQTPDYGNSPPPPPPELSASPPLSETTPLPDMAAPQQSQERTQAGSRNGA